MTERGAANEVQSRRVAEDVAFVAIEKFHQLHPAPEPKMELPAPLKWAAVIVTAIMTALASWMAIWMVSTLSDLQQTVTRIDERQQLTGNNTGQRIDKIEERLGRLEQAKQENSR